MHIKSSSPNSRSAPLRNEEKKVPQPGAQAQVSLPDDTFSSRSAKPRFQGENQAEKTQAVPDILTRQSDFSTLLGISVHPDFSETISNTLRQQWSGYDRGLFTKHAEQHTFPNAFGKPTVVTFCPTVTAANLLCLDADICPDESVLVADTSHINRFELGGIEALRPGVKVETIPSVKIPGSQDFGKITVKAFKQFLKEKEKNPASHQPRVLSITNPTEYGTLYAPEEIRNLAETAHKNGMLMHLDGARLFTWQGQSELSLKALTTDLGIDMLSLGGSKTGMLHAEAAVFLPEYFKHVRNTKDDEADATLQERLTRRKVQLGLRIGFAEDIPAQFILAMETGLAAKLGQQACENAQIFRKQLEGVLKDIPGAHLVAPVESNVVVVSVPKKLVEDLRYHMLRCGIQDPNPKQETILFPLAFGTQPEAMAKMIKAMRQWVEDQRIDSKTLTDTVKSVPERSASNP